MEPVTYFVTYGTAMAAYAYFVLTKQVSWALINRTVWLDTNYIIHFQEYLLPDVKDRQHLITLHKAAKKAGLDLIEYNDIKREIAEVEHDLRRLNDPLYKNLNASPPKTPNYSQTEIDSAKKLKTILADAKLLTGEKGSLAKITYILQEATKRLKK